MSKSTTSNSPNAFSDESYDFLFKVVLIGDCGVGKTCVVHRFRCGDFQEKTGNTIGVDFSMKTLTIDNKKIKLQIWDTAGQERFRTITQSYYRSANGVIIVYDITKRASFLGLQKWIEEVRRYAASNVLLILVGNKCDLESEREVEFTEAEEMGEYVPEIHYVLESSAKDSTNVEEAFYCLANELKNRQSSTLSSNEPATNEMNSPITLSDNTKSISKCSCVTL